MYETLVLIDNESQITADQIGASLQALFPEGNSREARVIRNGESLSVEFSGFVLEVHRSSESHVVDESREIATGLQADQQLRDRVSSCTARIELAGGNDFDMVYFNDFCLVLEALEDLGRVYTFDQGSGEFMNL